MTHTWGLDGWFLEWTKGCWACVSGRSGSSPSPRSWPMGRREMVSPSLPQSFTHSSLYVYFHWWVCVCDCFSVRVHECIVHRGQERGSDLLELERQAVESCSLWVLGTQPEASARAASALNPRAISGLSSLIVLTFVCSNQFICVHWNIPCLLL